ncbi:MAG TPA: hypothetical protein VF210_08510 [Pseudomonadales bacterium]
MAKPGVNKLILLFVLVAAAARADEADEAGDAAPAPGADRPAVEEQEAELQRRVEARTERAKRDAEFNRLDRDGDGYLSRQELTAKKDLRPGPDTLDRDADGRISRSEFAAVERSSVGPELPWRRQSSDSGDRAEGAREAGEGAPPG